MSRRNEGLLGDNAKVNLQQQFERSVAADKGAFSLQVSPHATDFSRKCHIQTIANMVIKLYGIYQPITTLDLPDREHSQALSAHKNASLQGLLAGSATADEQTVSTAEAAERPELSMLPARQRDINAAPSRKSLRGHPFGGSHAQTASPPQQRPIAGISDRALMRCRIRVGSALCRLRQQPICE